MAPERCHTIYLAVIVPLFIPVAVYLALMIRERFRRNRRAATAPGDSLFRQGAKAEGVRVVEGNGDLLGDLCFETAGQNRLLRWLIITSAHGERCSKTSCRWRKSSPAVPFLVRRRRISPSL